MMEKILYDLFDLGYNPRDIKTGKSYPKNILELINNDDLRTKFIKEGKKSSKRFTPDICADNFESLF